MALLRYSNGSTSIHLDYTDEKSFKKNKKKYCYIYKDLYKFPLKYDNEHILDRLNILQEKITSSLLDYNSEMRFKTSDLAEDVLKMKVSLSDIKVDVITEKQLENKADAENKVTINEIVDVIKSEKVSLYKEVDTMDDKDYNQIILSSLTEINTNLKDLRSEIKQDIKDLRLETKQDINNVEEKLIKRMQFNLTTIIAAVAAIATVLGVIISIVK